MNLSGNAFCVGLTAATLLIASGCKKHCKENEPDQTPKEKPALIKDCRIKSFTKLGDYPESLYFHYNEQGNPTHTSATPDGPPNRKFEYDSKHRLIRYSDPGITYPSSFNFRMHYFYDDKDRISYDSSFYTGNIGEDGKINVAYQFVNRYTYDEYGRVIKIVEQTVPSPYTSEATYTFYFSYDEHGNLANRDGAVYDDKPNYLRTNKIWMFLDRDYRVNNTRKAKTYNDKELPLLFRIDELPPVNIGFARLPGNYSEFSYECK